MIQNYLLSNCLLIIEDINQRFERYGDNEILKIAHSEFDESDLVFLMAYPFRNLIKVSMQGKKEDIRIKRLGFTIEVKYLYPTKNETGQMTNKRPFKEVFEKDFNWLVEQINLGSKGKSAFVLGWFNVFNSFSSVMQLGIRSGQKPKVNLDKVNYFPFLSIPTKECNVSSVKYRYQSDSLESVYNSEAYLPDTVPVPELKKGKINCIFLGKKTDKFHFAIYY